LGFWIAWFWYQKLKIFSFKYLVWKQGFLPREGFLPEFAGHNCKMLKVWRPIAGQFEAIFLDQWPNGKGAKIKKLIEDKIRRNFVGERNWRTTFLSAQLSWFFFSFIYNFLFGFHVSLAWLERCKPCFYCLISKGAAGASWSQLWKERKELYHSLDHWN